jgi:acyl CoA:acetate/3-ketoacid CoA transferase beta subunit
LCVHQAVFDVDKKSNQLILIEKDPQVTVDDLKSKTGAPFQVSPNLQAYRQVQE